MTNGFLILFIKSKHECPTSHCVCDTCYAKTPHFMSRIYKLTPNLHRELDSVIVYVGGSPRPQYDIAHKAGSSLYDVCENFTEDKDEGEVCKSLRCKKANK